MLVNSVFTKHRPKFENCLIGPNVTQFSLFFAVFSGDFIRLTESATLSVCAIDCNKETISLELDQNFDQSW